MLIISPTTCGFTKVATFNLLGNKKSANDCFQRKSRNEQLSNQIAEFNKQFIGYNENFYVQYGTFRTYFPKIVGSFMSLQKRKPGDKATILEVVSKGEWNTSEKKGNINYLIVVDV